MHYHGLLTGLRVKRDVAVRERGRCAAGVLRTVGQGLLLAVAQVLLARQVEGILDLRGHDLHGVLGSAPGRLVDDRVALGVEDGFLQPDLTVGEQGDVDVVLPAVLRFVDVERAELVVADVGADDDGALGQGH